MIASIPIPLRVTIPLLTFLLGAMLVGVNMWTLKAYRDRMEAEFARIEAVDLVVEHKDDMREFHEAAMKDLAKFQWLTALSLIPATGFVGWLLHLLITRRAERIVRATTQIGSTRVSLPEGLIGGRDELADIYEGLRRALLALERTQERYRILVETMPALVTVVRSSKFEYLNPAALATFGVGSVEEANVSSILDRVDSRDRTDAAGRLSAYMNGDLAARLTDLRIVAVGGEVREVHAATTGFRDDAGDAIQTVMIDVTARNQADREVRVLAKQLSDKVYELETLVHVMSHDLRSPLVNIQGFTQRLEQEWKQLA